MTQVAQLLRRLQSSEIRKAKRTKLMDELSINNDTIFRSVNDALSARNISINMTPADAANLAAGQETRMGV